MHDDIVEQMLGAAGVAERELRRTPAEMRAQWLDAIAEAVEGAAAELVSIAAGETSLPEDRLAGEIRRTVFQAKFFADILRRRGLAPVVIDASDPNWPPAPRPELKRIHVPLGTALVFGASNFPFAFGVLGTDTVSALAAGCPVIVKPHPAHPGTAAKLGWLAARALAAAGAPAGTFAVLEGHDEAIRALADARVRVGAFTGSRSGGMALHQIAVSRTDPIPFYAEMSSVNPVIVSPLAWASRPRDIINGFIDSLMTSAGQLCTSPGLVLVPSVDEFLERLELPPAPTLIHPGIVQGYRDALDLWAAVPGAVPHRFGAVSAEGVSTTILTVSARALIDDPSLFEAEIFGPGSVLVQYSDLAEVISIVESMPGQLTGTIHGVETEAGLSEIADRLIERAGRFIWNEWPTGVSVSYAQTHGGPFPATTVPSATSVGADASLRFLRPVTLQNVPDGLFR